MIRFGIPLTLALALTACDRMTAAPTPPPAPGPAAQAQVVPPQDVTLDQHMVKIRLSPLPADPKRGARIMSDRKLGNCVACHTVSALKDVPFQGNVGPRLDGAGSRWQEAQLRALVVNPKTYFPHTVMPAYYRVDGLNRVRPDLVGTPILSAEQVEDVVAFLTTLK